MCDSGTGSVKSDCERGFRCRCPRGVQKELWRVAPTDGHGGGDSRPGEVGGRLHQPCLLKVPMVGIDQYGYTAPAFSGSRWCGEKRDGKG